MTVDLKGRLRQGMRVCSADNTEHGTVERFDDTNVYVDGRPVPYGAFERMDQDRLYVGQSGARYFASGRGAEAPGAESEIRVPLVEEQLRVEKRGVDLGEAKIQKTVETEQVKVPVELRSEQVDIRRVDVDDRPAVAGEMMGAFEEGTIRVPVRGEEAVLTKDAVVSGEVVVNREPVVERETVSETVREQRVEVTSSYDEARTSFRQHFDRVQDRLRQAGGPELRARDFEDAEPDYRAGYDASRDPRYANRQFEDAEPELRRQHESGARSSGESWETRREQIRAGWEQARR